MTSAEKYMREQIATKAGHAGRIASDAETRDHLRRMTHKYGHGVLAPVERRTLDRLERP